jgi:hypothetical protein
VTTQRTTHRPLRSKTREEQRRELKPIGRLTTIITWLAVALFLWITLGDHHWVKSPRDAVDRCVEAVTNRVYSC